MAGIHRFHWSGQADHFRPWPAMDFVKAGEDVVDEGGELRGMGSGT
jgi:hypothetical protein